MNPSTLPNDQDIRDPAPDLTKLLHASPWQAPVTLTLVGINLLVFALMLLAGAEMWHTTNRIQLAWGANFGPATQDGQWWRLSTAMFLHFGAVHLLLNMWALWDVGRLVEQVLGSRWFVLLYLASGTIGNLLSLVVQGNQAVSGGASGAVFSLYGALLVFLLRERHQVEAGEFRSLFAAASVFTLLTLGMGFVIPGIDNAAHIGGLVCGALLALVLARRWTAKSAPIGPLRWLAAALLGALVLLMLDRLPAPIYRLSDERRAQAAIRQFLYDDQRISGRWGNLLSSSQTSGLSFEQLAGRIDSTVTTQYQENFEQLSALHLDPGAPSARTLEELLRYAALRGLAAQALSDGLRAKDGNQVREALEAARQAPAMAKRPSASASASRPQP